MASWRNETCVGKRPATAVGIDVRFVAGLDDHLLDQTGRLKIEGDELPGIVVVERNRDVTLHIAFGADILEGLFLYAIAVGVVRDVAAFDLELALTAVAGGIAGSRYRVDVRGQYCAAHGATKDRDQEEGKRGCDDCG